MDPLPKIKSRMRPLPPASFYPFSASCLALYASRWLSSYRRVSKYSLL